MLSITNRSAKPVYFRDKDGEVVEVPSEETKPVKIDRDHVHLNALENAHLVTVNDGTGAKKATPKKATAKETEPKASASTPPATEPAS